MPTHKDQPWSPPTRKDRIQNSFRSSPVTWVLIAVNVAVFAFSQVPAWDLLERGAMSAPEVLQDGQGYRLITSVFLHWDIGHLLCNLITLYSIGATVERCLDRKWKFPVLYGLSGLCGSLLVLGWDTLNHTAELTAGASGAIFGLFGVLLALAVKQKIRGVTKKQILGSIVLMLLPGVFSKGISLAAHLGGLLGGFLSALLLA